MEQVTRQSTPYALNPPPETRRLILLCTSHTKQREEAGLAPDVLKWGVLYDEEETWSLNLYSNTQEVNFIREKLEPIIDDKEILDSFRSFLVKLDQDGCLVTAWGLATTVCWPDSYGFKLL